MTRGSIMEKLEPQPSAERKGSPLEAEAIEEIKTLMKPLLKKAAKMTLKRIGKIPDGTELQSHFGGQPYFEKGEQWPQAKNGNNLVFVFQSFNDGNMGLSENIKLIQFYYDFDDLTPWKTDDDGYLVKVYETLHKENMIIIKKPPEYFTRYYNKPDEKEDCNWIPYCEIEFKPILTLPTDEFVDEYSNKKFSTLENYNEIAQDLIGYDFYDYFSQLGGYPQWIQGGIELQDGFDFLFQIDSEDEAGIMWSDCGMVHVFYNSKTKQFIFEKECY